MISESLATLTMAQPDPVNIAPLARRLAALLYDGLLLLAVLVFASALLLLVTTHHTPGPHYSLWHSLYFLSVSYLFFGWFWIHGGQTLGMRAWRLRLQRVVSPYTVSWRLAGLRLILGLPLWIYVACLLLASYTPLVNHYLGLYRLAQLPLPLRLGIALIWLLLDHWPNNWRDRVSRTQVILVN
ncbi:MAG: RDD family protein [Gammaproteobacteria bacterium]|nr:RDD family protein [Gammaproteobacteria bacterium]